MRTLTACAIIASLAASAFGQAVVHLYPTDPAHDANWFTGVAAISADGAVVAGWQNFDANTAYPAVWTLDGVTTRALGLTPVGAVAVVSTDGTQFLGRITGTSSHPYVCGSSGCAELTTFVSVPTGYRLSNPTSASGDLSVLGGVAVTPQNTGASVCYYKNDVLYVSTVRPASGTTSISADGSTMYFAGIDSSGTNLYRWVLDGTSIPVALQGTSTDAVSIGSSDDGQVGYFCAAQTLYVYTDGEGMQAVTDCCGGNLLSITPDGRRAVGRVGDENTAAIIWDPFNGTQLLSDLVSGMPNIRSSIVISADGETIAGVADHQPKSYAFYVRLPMDQRPADYSRDGNVDQDDIGSFAQLLTGSVTNEYALPLDFNRDGNSDVSDLLDLINCVAGGCE